MPLCAHKKTPTSVFRDICYQSQLGDRIKRRLATSTKDSINFVQSLSLYRALKVHRGCVNTVTWNERGNHILSGSDDQTLVVTNPFTGDVVVKCKTGHRANIFSAKFMPHTGDREVVSCSGDGNVIYTELMQSPEVCNTANINEFNCHSNSTTYEVVTIAQEPRSFMSCGEDGTVRLFDLRKISNCHKMCCKENIVIMSPSSITAMAVSPVHQNYIAVGSSDSHIRIYDRRFLSYINFTAGGEQITLPVKAFMIPSLEKRPFRVTSVSYSSDGCQLLVSYSSDHLYLFDISRQGVEVVPLNDKVKRKMQRQENADPPPVRRLRLRGDWSDTGPDARPEREAMEASATSSGQVRPILHATMMNRMTEVISRMLADPRTRANLNLLSHLGQQANPTLAEEQRQQEAGPSSGTGTAPPPYGNGSKNARDHDADASNYTSDEDEETETKSELSALQEDDIEPETNYDYLLMKFTGHRNARTMIKEASFWGDEYIMSGSDCGHVFTWERATGKLVMLMEADHHVVNCVQPHPTLPYLATSGIDYDVKIWAPFQGDDFENAPRFDEAEAQRLMERNAVMLEETKDTITVPAAVMIRMLACIHSFRNRNRGNIARIDDEDE
ncbi:DDB1- and CUL4-associated factor 6-like [Phlebotomus argentipes]|uniref:DDB1- and CUL4-associated factor 6-like n=1 Tax=Phlebotomus argentipes TaxID=94469 RepID=UPI0028934433|nr:DDB1- and CUL4-associated factor 6-like [Phlebotomus argentipes]